MDVINIDIPGFGKLKLMFLVSDFTGTLSTDGRLLAGIKDRLNRLADKLEIHVLTADTFGTATNALKGVRCSVHILKGGNLDVQKQKFVKKLGPEKTVAIGNGNNDRKMVRSARLGIIVIGDEGAASQALISADVVVKSPLDALDILLAQKRCKATLRY